jgi:hypothetical protein
MLLYPNSFRAVVNCVKTQPPWPQRLNKTESPHHAECLVTFRSDGSISVSTIKHAFFNPSWHPKMIKIAKLTGCFKVGTDENYFSNDGVISFSFTCSDCIVSLDVFILMVRILCSSGNRAIAVLVLFRLFTAIYFVRTYFVPDEFWQSVEIAHRFVFGSAIRYEYLTLSP